MDAPVIYIFKVQGYIPHHWKYLFQGRYRLLKYGAQLQLQLQLQKALFDTNIHEHNNNIHVIMLCLETLIKVYTYRLHKSHQGRSDGIRVILSTIACDQRNKTTFCMKWTHSFAQWAAVYKWTYKIYFFNMMALVTAIGARYKPVIDQVVDCTI